MFTQLRCVQPAGSCVGLHVLPIPHSSGFLGSRISSKGFHFLPDWYVGPVSPRTVHHPSVCIHGYIGMDSFSLKRCEGSVNTICQHTDSVEASWAGLQNPFILLSTQQATGAHSWNSMYWRIYGTTRSVFSFFCSEQFQISKFRVSSGGNSKISRS